MGRRLLITVVAIALTVAGLTTAASASPAEEYTGTHFGVGNLPAGCAGDTFTSPDNACYHMRTGLNALDSPEVDVLILVPASPTATHDMRIMREAVDMWNGGIHYLAPQMGVPWMKDMHFHVSTDIEHVTDGYVTYPIWDPEIVVVATNPVGGLGIGIDPWASAPVLPEVLGKDEPCHGVRNPFDMATWQNMPGYDHHGDERGATVSEDCGGAGGNVCFAINTAIDPSPPDPDVFNLFDLVAHEFGHCLTLGHVGDGAEGPWSKVPTNDIMSYNLDPPGLNKCVSTLDVEGLAVTQSHYIDVNGDGLVNDIDHVDANEAKWDDTTDHFQVQAPRDHFYASSTGDPMDCPQPYLGMAPGPRPDWTPQPKSTSTNQLTVGSPGDGARAADRTFRVRGSVAHVRTGKWPPETATSTEVAAGPPQTVTFHHDGGNHFDPQDTNLGLGFVPHDHHFTLDLAERSDVRFRLDFTNASGLSDIDFVVQSGSEDSGSEGATQSDPEQVSAHDLKGKLKITVTPYLIAEIPDGVDYTLTAIVTPKKIVTNVVDAAVSPANEHVRVYVDDAKAWAAHQNVDTTNHASNFDIGVMVPRGRHTLRVEWDRAGKVVAAKTLSVTSG